GGATWVRRLAGNLALVLGNLTALQPAESGVELQVTLEGEARLEFAALTGHLAPLAGAHFGLQGRSVLRLGAGGTLLEPQFLLGRDNSQLENHGGIRSSRGRTLFQTSFDVTSSGSGPRGQPLFQNFGWVELSVASPEP